MPIFITQGRYTQDAIKGMLAKPDDREAALRLLAEKAGAKILAYYMTLGEYDFIVIYEGPLENAAIPAIVTTAGGGVTGLKTTLAMTTAEMKDAFAKAGALAASFKSAGQ